MQVLSWDQILVLTFGCKALEYLKRSPALSRRRPLKGNGIVLFGSAHIADRGWEVVKISIIHASI